MLKSVQGIYHDGKVDLLEPVPPDVHGRVIVTFLSESDGEDGDEVQTPTRREGGLLVYDGKLTGSVEATIEAVREERMRQFFPGTRP